MAKARVWMRPKVGGQEQTVYEANDVNCPSLADSEGVSNDAIGFAAVHQNLSDDRAEETLLHEIFHSCFGVSGARYILKETFDVDDDVYHELEEYIVRLINPVLYSTLKGEGWLKIPKRPSRRRKPANDNAKKKRKAKRLV